MTRSLRLSTALVTSLSLVAGQVPLAAFAQTPSAECQTDAASEACLAEALEAAGEAVEGETEEVIDDAAAAGAAAQVEAEAAAAQAEADAAAAAQAEADAAAAAQAEAEAAAAAQAEADAAATAQAEADAAAAAQAEAEAAAAAQAEADAAATAQAEADAAAAAQAEAEAAAAAQAEADAAATAQAEADADAAAQAEAEAAGAAAAQAEEDAAAAEQADAAEQVEQPAAEAEAPAVEEQADTAARTDEEALAAALAEAAAADAAAEQEGAEQAPAQDAAPTAEAPAADAPAAEPAPDASAQQADTPAEPAPAPQQAEDEAAELARAAELAAAAEQEAAVDPAVQAEAESQEQAAEAEQQMQSMALSEDAAPQGEVVTQTITEEDARSAEQEFAPIVSTEPAAEATATAEPERRGGLSSLETALLAGAAGVVVGTILSGNRQVVNRADDRVVVLRPQGDYQVIRDDDVLLRQPGNGIATENFSDGSSRSVVTQPDGAQIVTIRDRDLRILRRTYVAPDGSATVLIDDTASVAPVEVSQLPQVRPVSEQDFADATDDSALRAALQAEQGLDRSFSLAQIRSIRAVRDLAPAVDLDAVTFASGSAAIGPEEARALLALGTFMSEAIAANPAEVFLVEGHTDAVGSAAFNLALSDRRAESVARALAQYFGVPAQNLVIQGYGEDYLRVPTLEDERTNRRVAVRRITPLLQVASR